MNYLALVNFQRIIFSIIFILSGIYLILFFVREILMIFIPEKYLLNTYKDLKNLSTPYPEIINPVSTKQNTQHKSKKSYLKYNDKSSGKNIKEKRKSRKRKKENNKIL